jgi:hypothetical protein
MVKGISGLSMLCIVACGQAPEKDGIRQAAPAEENDTIQGNRPSEAFTEDSIQKEMEAAAARQEADRSEPTIPSQPSDATTTVESPAAEPTEVTMDNMDEQLAQQIAARQNANGESLTAEQSEAATAKVMAVVKAAESGNPLALTLAANDLNAFAADMQGEQGLGLVDVAGVVDAIQDLIAAALDLDVAGIVDAVMDLIDAIIG